jgi:hypothetical protein
MQFTAAVDGSANLSLPYPARYAVESGVFAIGAENGTVANVNFTAQLTNGAVLRHANWLFSRAALVRFGNATLAVAGGSQKLSVELSAWPAAQAVAGTFSITAALVVNASHAQLDYAAGVYTITVYGGGGAAPVLSASFIDYALVQCENATESAAAAVSVRALSASATSYRFAIDVAVDCDGWTSLAYDPDFAVLDGWNGGGNTQERCYGSGGGGGAAVATAEIAVIAAVAVTVLVGAAVLAVFLARHRLCRGYYRRRLEAASLPGETPAFRRARPLARSQIMAAAEACE